MSSDVPEGIVNLDDLTNGAYPQYASVSWEDEYFQDILAWIREHGIPEPTYITSKYEQGHYAPTDIMWTNSSKGVHFADAIDVVHSSAHLLASLKKLFFGIPGHDTIELYPGYALRHPLVPSPIGAPWPDHPFILAGNKFKMFHPAPSDVSAVGGEWSQLSTSIPGKADRFLKIRFVTSTNFFQQNWDVAWQQVY